MWKLYQIVSVDNAHCPPVLKTLLSTRCCKARWSLIAFPHQSKCSAETEDQLGIIAGQGSLAQRLMMSLTAVLTVSPALCPEACMAGQ